MSSKTIILGVGIAVALGAVGTWLWWQSATSKPSGSPASLDQSVVARGEAAFQDKKDFAKTFRELFEGTSIPTLTAAEVKAYVEGEGRSAGSLVAAWQISSDKAWLEEAAQKHPDDPQVALAMLSMLKDLGSPADEWITRLKQSDPQNGLPWCYEALQAFHEGSPETARAALMEAARSKGMNDYHSERSANLARAYWSAGYDGLIAEALGQFSTSLPQADLLVRLNREISGIDGPPDDGVVEDMLSLARMLRGRGGEPSPLIHDLVAVSMEGTMLQKFSSWDLVPGTRDLVVQRLVELEAQRNTVRTVSKQAAPLLSSMTESEWKQYLRRLKVEGELKAMEWLIQRRGANAQAR
jgi:hypothetical protein